MGSLREDIERLSVAERILLVEDIWDSIAARPDELAVSDAQRAELDRRVDAYRRDPNRGVSWQDVKAKMKGNR